MIVVTVEAFWTSWVLFSKGRFWIFWDVFGHNLSGILRMLGHVGPNLRAWLGFMSAKRVKTTWGIGGFTFWKRIPKVLVNGGCPNRLEPKQKGSEAHLATKMADIVLTSFSLAHLDHFLQRNHHQLSVSSV